MLALRSGEAERCGNRVSRALTPPDNRRIGAHQPRWWPGHWPITKGSMQSVVLNGLHYIRNGDGREEDYDLDAD